jgi:hypothetical protein
VQELKWVLNCVVQDVKRRHALSRLATRPTRFALTASWGIFRRIYILELAPPQEASSSEYSQLDDHDDGTLSLCSFVDCARFVHKPRDRAAQQLDAYLHVDVFFVSDFGVGCNCLEISGCVRLLAAGRQRTGFQTGVENV